MTTRVWWIDLQVDHQLVVEIDLQVDHQRVGVCTDRRRWAWGYPYSPGKKKKFQNLRAQKTS
jgi:hypothetical protein